MQNLIGLKFGRLTIKQFSHYAGHGNAFWLCSCDCGIEKIVGQNAMRSGNTKSCGCLKKEKDKIPKRLIHGCRRKSGQTREYGIWANMKDRCNNPNNKCFYLYGERGIKVCERWDKFENFLADMGECPIGLSLDRKNNELGYSPENCRWATKLEQGRNKRNNRIIEFRGKKMTLGQWAAETGLKRQAIANRIDSGWSIELALTKQNRLGIIH